MKEVPFIYDTNIIQNFTNNIFGNVRSILINGEPWFVASDIAKILGYRDAEHMTRNIIDSRDKGTHSVGTPGGMQQMTIINESGLYSAIFSSKLPAAIEFKHWVTHEVLPTMRQIGFSNSMNILQGEMYKLQEENNNLRLSNDELREDIISMKIELEDIYNSPNN